MKKLLITMLALVFSMGTIASGVDADATAKAAVDDQAKEKMADGDVDKDAGVTEKDDGDTDKEDGDVEKDDGDTDKDDGE